MSDKYCGDKLRGALGFGVSFCVGALPTATMASYLVNRFRQRELGAVLKTLPSAPTKGEPFKVPNPFIPRKNPVTGRWAPPKYSRRRQADLIKAAKATNTLHLLPRGPKMGLTELHKAVKAVPRAERPLESRTAPWSRYVSWTGKAKHKSVKGADVGNRLYAGRKRMFKGHKWQRTMERRLGRRNMLVRSMKRRIIRFKSVSTYATVLLNDPPILAPRRFTSADVLALWLVREFLPRCPNCPSNSILSSSCGIIFKLSRSHHLRIHLSMLYTGTLPTSSYDHRFKPYPSEVRVSYNPTTHPSRTFSSPY